MYRLLYNGDTALVSWRFFKARAKRPYLNSYGSSEQRGKNRQLVAARRVALKMDRLLRCSSVTYRFRHAPSARLADGHFERNGVVNNL
jgi:hypothetical protein